MDCGECWPINMTKHERHRRRTLRNNPTETWLQKSSSGLNNILHWHGRWNIRHLTSYKEKGDIVESILKVPLCDHAGVLQGRQKPPKVLTWQGKKENVWNLFDLTVRSSVQLPIFYFIFTIEEYDKSNKDMMWYIDDPTKT